MGRNTRPWYNPIIHNKRSRKGCSKTSNVLKWKKTKQGQLKRWRKGGENITTLCIKTLKSVWVKAFSKLSLFSWLISLQQILPFCFFSVPIIFEIQMSQILPDSWGNCEINKHQYVIVSNLAEIQSPSHSFSFSPQIEKLLAYFYPQAPSS